MYELWRYYAKLNVRRKTNTVGFHICGVKNKQNKQRKTHRCRDQLRVIRVEAGRGMGEVNKEVNCMAINVYYTCGGYNFIVHTYVKV